MKIDKILAILIIMVITLFYLAATENQIETIPEEIFTDYSNNFTETDTIIWNPNFETCEKYNLTICQKQE